MKQEELQAFAQEAVKGIKTEEDLIEFRQILTKITVEAVLNRFMILFEDRLNDYVYFLN